MSPQMQPGDLCLVTGGSGYLATWIEKYLLEGGYRVRGTVRSLKDTEKLETLRALLPGVKFVEANLREEAGWKGAVEGCKWVFHVASPQAMPGESDRVGGAVARTRYLLDAAFNSAGSTVQKVVVTSSKAAVTYGHPCSQMRIDEDNWTDTNVVTNDYLSSKTIAKQATWDVARDPARNPRRVPVSTVCPGFILGPTLVPWGRYSLQTLKDIAEGNTPVLPDMTLHMVDIRDCARMHIAIMDDPSNDGHHHLSFGAVGKMVDLGLIVHDQYGSQGFKPSTWVMPNAIMCVLKYVTSDIASLHSRIGVHFPYETKYPNVYTYEFSSLPEMAHTSMESMIENKWIESHPNKKGANKPRCRLT